MEASNVARIESIVDKHAKWDTNELVFKTGLPLKFDVIPYL
jgi:hypothetical protein